MKCALRFPDTASDVVLVLLDFLGDDQGKSGSNDEAGGSANEVISFVREFMHTYPSLRYLLLVPVSSFSPIIDPMS